ncbi:hypothetical protein ACWD4G_40740 [Streptomyces sp. NPDC002643]
MNHGPEEQGPTKGQTKGQDLEGRTPDEPGQDAPRSEGMSTAYGRGAPAQGPDGGGPDGGGLNGHGSGGHGPGGHGLNGHGLDDHGSGGHAPSGSVPTGDASPALGGSDADELVLRNLLHQAVAEIEPRDGTLEHLRRAVPARRARKRQAVVGMAAAALFIGTAIPALVHVSNSTGSEINPSAVGNGSQTQGGSGDAKPESGQSGSSGGSSGGAAESGKGGTKDKDDEGKGQSSGSGSGGTETTPATESIPACTSAQLSGSGSTGSPDSVGAVYGTFRVSNVSGDSCLVAGAGGVLTTPQGAADPAKITTADHVAGDVATGLPDPSLSPAELVLAPGASYEVQFAWVPSETCPTVSDPTGGTTGGEEPTPDPTPTEEEGTTSGTTTTEGSTTNSATTQLLTEDGVADGSVLVSHTVEGGVATVTATVSNACAGTVYRTGLLATS